MQTKRQYELDTKALKWLLAVADAITEVGPPPAGFDLADIDLTYDGEFTALGIGGSEFGDEYVVMTTTNEAQS